MHGAREQRARLRETQGMIAPQVARVAAALFVFAFLMKHPALAEPTTAPAKPLVGQQGKDAIWVPTPNALIELMLDLAKVTPQDKVVDLGSGDGRAVIAAAKRGATARGIEYDANLVALSKASAEREGVSDKARFERADMFATDFSDASVVVLFLLPDLNLKLRPSILRMTPGTRVVSNTFEMGGWLPDKSASLREECDFFFCKALLWIVPARIDGTWVLEAGDLAGTLSFKQEFQTFTGALTNGDTVTPVTDGKLTGDSLGFSAGETAFAGRVRGDMIEGTTLSGAVWKAKRAN